MVKKKNSNNLANLLKRLDSCSFIFATLSTYSTLTALLIYANIDTSINMPKMKAERRDALPDLMLIEICGHIDLPPSGNGFVAT